MDIQFDVRDECSRTEPDIGTVPYRRADWSQDRRYQALSSWGSGEQGRVGQWVKREGQIGSVYN